MEILFFFFINQNLCHIWTLFLLFLFLQIRLHGTLVQDFFEKNIEKKHLCHQDKNYFYICKSNILVDDLIVGSKNMIKVSKNMSL